MITCAWCRSRSTVAVARSWASVRRTLRVDVGADRDRAFLVGGVDDAEQRVGGVCETGSSPTSSIRIRSERISLLIALLMLSSARWRRNSAASVSSVCQGRCGLVDREVTERFDEVRSYPLPLGPHTTRTSARLTHSSVRSACLRLGRGSPRRSAPRRRTSCQPAVPTRGGASRSSPGRGRRPPRPAAPENFSVFPALAGGGRDHFRRRSANVWHAQTSQQPVELVGQRRWGGRLDGHRSAPIAL